MAGLEPPQGEAGRVSSPRPSAGRPHAPSAQRSHPHPASRAGRRRHCTPNRGAGRGPETPGWLDQGHRLRDRAHIPLVSTQACKPPPPLRQGRPILDSRHWARWGRKPSSYSLVLEEAPGWPQGSPVTPRGDRSRSSCEVVLRGLGRHPHPAYPFPLGHGLQHTALRPLFPTVSSLVSASRSGQMTTSPQPTSLACHEVIGCHAAGPLPGPPRVGSPRPHQVRRPAGGRGLYIAPHPPDWLHPLPVPFHTVCIFSWGKRGTPLRSLPIPEGSRCRGWDRGCG